ncbi:MAG: hypothetical protein ACOX7R_10815 [Acetivibrionales bacterium]
MIADELESASTSGAAKSSSSLMATSSVVPILLSYLLMVRRGDSELRCQIPKRHPGTCQNLAEEIAPDLHIEAAGDA